MRTSRLVALVFVLASFPSFLSATTFVVNADGSGTDLVNGDGSCATVLLNCTLHAAIQEANYAPGPPHTINFSIPVVTLATSLPTIITPMTINGIFGAPRVQIVGAVGTGSFSVSDTAGGATPGSGTTLKNLVIRNMASNGISLVGGGALGLQLLYRH